MKQIESKKNLTQMRKSNRELPLQSCKKAKPISNLKEICDLLESRIEKIHQCPHCQSQKFIKHGFRNHLTRYRCKNCSKTFNALTKSPLARLRKKQLWLPYAKCLLKSNSLRKAASTITVSLSTSFRWRHRFMRLAQKNESQLLTGTIEANEVFFLKSKKGAKNLKRPPRKRGTQVKLIHKNLVSVLIACDRNGHEADYITGIGRLSATWLKNNFQHHLHSQALLITKPSEPFNAFCQQQNIAHASINLQHNTLSFYHIKTVHGYSSTLNSWLKRFHGVATKYLDHYLGWCHELHNRKFKKPREIIQFAFDCKTA